MAVDDDGGYYGGSPETNPNLKPLDGGGGGGFGSALNLGALGLGAGALGYLMAKGPASLPEQYQQLEGQAPILFGQGSQLFGQGQGLITSGQQALDMARRGELTPEQTAQLQLSRQGLQNFAAQTYAAMGRTGPDTSKIGTQADIETRVTAMAQSYLDTTIKIGLGELGAGTNLTGQALGFEKAGMDALQAAGNAQIQLDKQYSDSFASMFGSVAKMAGQILPLIAMA
jgi:hypothetical protein